MGEYRWIKDSGLVSEKDICSEALRTAPEKSLFLACGTNYFRAGHADGKELGTLKLDRLLELRIFSEQCEIYFRRTSAGRDFQWRLASEQDVPEDCYIVQYQTLDINQDRAEKMKYPTDEYGNLQLFTTVGGKYVLPADPAADSSEIICYIAYDKNGMAKIADYRLKGFVKRTAPGEGSEKL